MSEISETVLYNQEPSSPYLHIAKVPALNYNTVFKIPKHNVAMEYLIALYMLKLLAGVSTVRLFYSTVQSTGNYWDFKSITPVVCLLVYSTAAVSHHLLTDL